MYSNIFVAFLFALLAVASPVGKRAVPQIRADLVALQSSITEIDNAAVAFSNTDGNLLQGFAVHSGAVAVDNAITKTTADVKNTGPVTDTDANMILNDIEAIEPMVTKALEHAVEKKQGVDKFGVNSFVRYDLQTLQSDARDLGSALIYIVPTSHRPRATRIVNSINMAMASAVAAFS